MWFWYNDFRVERCLLLEPGRWLDLKLSYNKYSCTASATSILTETDFLWFHWIENSIHIYKSLSAIGTINFVATLKSTPTCLQIQIEFCIRRYCSGCWKLDVWCATADNLPTNSPTQIFFHQHTSCAIRRQRAMQEKKYSEWKLSTCRNGRIETRSVDQIYAPFAELLRISAAQVIQPPIWIKRQSQRQ